MDIKETIIKWLLPMIVEKILSGLTAEEMRNKVAEWIKECKEWVIDSKSPWDDKIAIPVLDKICDAFSIPKLPLDP